MTQPMNDLQRQTLAAECESGWQDAMQEFRNAVVGVYAGRRTLGWLENRLADLAIRYPDGDHGE